MTITKSPLQRALAILPLTVFAILFVYLSVASSNFLTPGTIELILKQAVPTVVVSIGLATVVIAGGDDVVLGGIDLSIPATAIICAAIIADQVTNNGASILWGLTLAFGAAGIVGAINAGLVVWVRMTPLLATLATSVAVVGVTKVITESRRIGIADPVVIFMRDDRILGVAAGVVLTAIIALVFWHLVHRTRWGMNLQATGGSRDAAEISGIDTKRFVVQSFLLAAFAGWLASMFVLARGSGSSPGSEENLLLEMVLATFLGAAFSPRRVVTVWGAVLGAVLVSALSVGFISIGVNVFWTGCIKGGLILLVVASASAGTDK
jgi:ribose transport system permease protein